VKSLSRRWIYLSWVSFLYKLLVTYWLIGFKASFAIFWAAAYGLAMASTALAVLLGCSVEDPKLADELTPLLFVPQMLFAGFFVTPALIPIWLRWARFLCSLTYAVRIALAAEFEGCAQTLPGCQNVLNDAEADPDDTWWNWLVLVVLFAVFRLMALFVLRKKATKFF
jgi:ABC-type multidrug transport system permease subunit